MALPESIRVKLSTEAAESISITPVVSREMPLRELVELMLGLTGKDAARVRDLLQRGGLVSGASRFRWTGWAASETDIAALLATFPDADPSRPFDVNRCVRVLLRGPALLLELPCAAARQRRFLRRSSYWDALILALADSSIEYLRYSYRDRADVYQARFSPSTAAVLRDRANLLKYVSLARQIAGAGIDSAELYTER